MPRYRHPRVDPDAEGDPGFAVSLNGETVPLDSDGTFESDADAAVKALAESYGTTAESIRVGSDPDEPPDDDPPTCVGADGDCSREVDEPGGTCWQHDDA